MDHNRQKSQRPSPLPEGGILAGRGRRFAFRPHFMQTSRPVTGRFFHFCLSLACLAATAAAADWTLLRFEGRDYVTLENVASFYDLPAPPHIDPTEVGS